MLPILKVQLQGWLSTVTQFIHMDCGLFKNTYVNIQFWIKITWLSLTSHVFTWGLWGENKASDFYELNLTGIDKVAK